MVLTLSLITMKKLMNVALVLNIQHMTMLLMDLYMWLMLKHIGLMLDKVLRRPMTPLHSIRKQACLSFLWRFM